MTRLINTKLKHWREMYLDAMRWRVLTRVLSTGDRFDGCYKPGSPQDRLTHAQKLVNQHIVAAVMDQVAVAMGDPSEWEGEADSFRVFEAQRQELATAAWLRVVERIAQWRNW